jgi:ribose 5-phosphate isomerase A
MFAELGKVVAAKVKNGEVLGIGTGATVDAVLEQIGKRITAEKLVVYGIPTSRQAAQRCSEVGIKALDPVHAPDVSWGFDGADAVDPKGRLVKGKGGAMLQEKILAAQCREYLVVVDRSKLVDNLAVCEVPLEVVPAALNLVSLTAQKLGAGKIVLREGIKRRPIYTEYGNLILDLTFSTISDELSQQLSAIPGVVEHGIFIGFTTEILIADEGKVERRIIKS